MDMGAEGEKVLTPEEERQAVAMARRALETYLSTGTPPDDARLGVPADGPFRLPGAAFVTLKRRGRLRGCIGHILPSEPLWESIRDNAVAAAVHDSRFARVSRAELEELDLEISVLTPLRSVAGPEEFVPGRQGVLMELGGRRAVFLPQVAAEQGWDRETTLAYLSQKAGLPPDAWRDPRARLSVFEAQVFHETSR